MNVKEYYQSYSKYKIIYSEGMTFSVSNLQPLRSAFSATMQDEEKLAAMSCTKGIDREDVAAALRAFRQGHSYNGLKLHRIELSANNLGLYLRGEDEDVDNVDDERFVIWVFFRDSSGYMTFRNESEGEAYAISWRDGKLMSVTETLNSLERYIRLTYIQDAFGGRSLGNCKVTEKYPIHKTDGKEG
ncbi:hypothetical protein IJM16_01895 [Candidatus Saccharibacteria bacterium]|nr:hypothetical protein [Candidatus Saccharibacteria bacterium]